MLLSRRTFKKKVCGIFKTRKLRDFSDKFLMTLKRNDSYCEDNLKEGAQARRREEIM